MNKVLKISTYGLILYLALMICCVQSAYLHHSLHHNMLSQHHSSQMQNANTHTGLMAVSTMTQAENTLFKNIFSLGVLASLLFIFILLSRNILFPVNAILAYIKRQKFKRRWRNLLLTSSFGLRSPPA